MAVRLECFNVIIPIANIDKYYPGGFDGFKQDNSDLIGAGMWYDDRIFRDGAMNHLDVEMILDSWKRLGLKITSICNGKEYWDELCVVSLLQDESVPCRWLKIRDGMAVYDDGWNERACRNL